MQAIRIFSVRGFSSFSIGEKTAASFVFVTDEWRKAITAAPCQEKQKYLSPHFLIYFFVCAFFQDVFCVIGEIRISH